MPELIDHFGPCRVVELMPETVIDTAAAGVEIDPVTSMGAYSRALILLEVSAADDDAGDTLDVFVDVSFDGEIWVNAVHFDQILGNGGAQKRFAVLDPAGATGTVDVDPTSDAAAGAVRPQLFGPQFRVRYTAVEDGGADMEFTVRVSAFFQR